MTALAFLGSWLGLSSASKKRGRVSWRRTLDIEPLEQREVLTGLGVLRGLHEPALAQVLTSLHANVRHHGHQHSEIIDPRSLRHPGKGHDHSVSPTAGPIQPQTGSSATGLTLSPATLPNATVNRAYSVTFSATGGSGTYTYSVTSGSLPPWLTLNSGTGVLSGTPPAAGTWNFTITATDCQNSNLTGSQAYTLTAN